MLGRLDVQWTPITNKFLTWGSEISLYEVQPLRENTKGIKLSRSTCATLQATNSSLRFVKSIDIYPKCISDVLLAVGLSSGRISLTTFGPSEHDNQGFPGKELIPKNGRHCNIVSFNPIQSNLLAEGLDKHKSDNSVLIWDINKFSTNNERGKSTTGSASEPVRPVAEFGMSELTNSLGWFRMNSNILASGMNFRYIKLFDIRDQNRLLNTSPTKSVFGICIDPNDDKNIASYHENQVTVWDIRYFEKPLLLLSHNKPIVKIAWSPTRNHLLSVLEKDNSLINLYDIHHTTVANEEVEPIVLERFIEPGSSHNLISFSWHHSDDNRLITIAPNGVMTDYTISDRTAIDWSATCNLVWTHGKKTLKCISDESLNDISNVMRRRAKTKYGLREELELNAKYVVDEDECLANVWKWLHLSEKLVEDGAIQGMPLGHPGVQAVLNLDPTENESEGVVITWADLGYENCQGAAKFYRNEDRNKALRLCSWPVDRDVGAIDIVEREQAYTRAAALAIFNLKIKEALLVLSRVPPDHELSTSLNIVAMALAGFSDNKDSVWRQFCTTSTAKLTDPYLKAIFAFLTAEDYNYENVLNENGMAVNDKVGFACMFLPDVELTEYVRKLSENLIEEGNLDGFLLTGNSFDGLKLLQKYLDRTCDIQSTTLIAVRGFTNDLRIESINEWIQSYRDVLNNWKYWHERAKFDIMLVKYKPSEIPPRQVYLCCNFCGKSVTAYVQALSRGRGMVSSGTKFKLTSCPNCRKPLPRCSVCSMNLGTTAKKVECDATGDLTLADFGNWFTWCQCCKHGGHVRHMNKWFKEHQECPVTTCSCKCYGVDGAVGAMSACKKK